jgi:hypothetical protein
MNTKTEEEVGIRYASAIRKHFRIEACCNFKMNKLNTLIDTALGNRIDDA